MFRLRMNHGDGNSERPRADRDVVVVGDGDPCDGGSPVLPASERAVRQQWIRPVRGRGMQGVLRQEDGTAESDESDSWNLLPVAVGGLLRGDRLRAWNSLASGRFAFPAAVPDHR